MGMSFKKKKEIKPSAQFLKTSPRDLTLLGPEEILLNRGTAVPLQVFGGIYGQSGLVAMGTFPV